MTYQKPKDVRYVDMAIFIDKNIYSKEYDEQTCFEYMYHLYYILAVKRRLFTSAKDYDDYAIYCASILMHRYKRRKDSNLEPIKSSLNYIRKTFYPMYITFQKDNFEQRFTNDLIGTDGIENIRTHLTDSVSTLCSDILRSELSYYLSDAKFIVKQTLKENVKFVDKSTFHNIYISCLFTLLQQLSISADNLERLNRKKVVTDDTLTSIYNEETKDNVILYHLDNTMGNLISTIVNKIKHNMVQDIMYLIQSNAPDERVVRDILNTPREIYSDS